MKHENNGIFKAPPRPPKIDDVIKDIEEGRDPFEIHCPTGEPGPAGGPLDGTAKADTGKPRLDLVPPSIIEAIGVIRTYGTNKYHDPENWRKVEPERYRAALMRHLCAYLRDPTSVDEESGYKHMWHLACNVAFLIELECPYTER
jgi:hypothetical protein